MDIPWNTYGSPMGLIRTMDRFIMFPWASFGTCMGFQLVFHKIVVLADGLPCTSHGTSTGLPRVYNVLIFIGIPWDLHGFTELAHRWNNERT